MWCLRRCRCGPSAASVPLYVAKRHLRTRRFPAPLLPCSAAEAREGLPDPLRERRQSDATSRNNSSSEQTLCAAADPHTLSATGATSETAQAALSSLERIRAELRAVQAELRQQAGWQRVKEEPQRCLNKDDDAENRVGKTRQGDNTYTFTDQHEAIVDDSTANDDTANVHEHSSSDRCTSSSTKTDSNDAIGADTIESNATNNNSSHPGTPIPAQDKLDLDIQRRLRRFHESNVVRELARDEVQQGVDDARQLMQRHFANDAADVLRSVPHREDAVRLARLAFPHVQLTTEGVDLAQLAQLAQALQERVGREKTRLRESHTTATPVLRSKDERRKDVPDSLLSEMAWCNVLDSLSDAELHRLYHYGLLDLDCVEALLLLREEDASATAGAKTAAETTANNEADRTKVSGTADYADVNEDDVVQSNYQDDDAARRRVTQGTHGDDATYAPHASTVDNRVDADSARRMTWVKGNNSDTSLQHDDSALRRVLDKEGQQEGCDEAEADGSYSPLVALLEDTLTAIHRVEYAGRIVSEICNSALRGWSVPIDLASAMHKVVNDRCGEVSAAELKRLEEYEEEAVPVMVYTHRSETHDIRGGEEQPSGTRRGTTTEAGPASWMLTTVTRTDPMRSDFGRQTRNSTRTPNAAITTTAFTSAILDRALMPSNRLLHLVAQKDERVRCSLADLERVRRETLLDERFQLSLKLANAMESSDSANTAYTSQTTRANKARSARHTRRAGYDANNNNNNNSMRVSLVRRSHAADVPFFFGSRNSYVPPRARFNLPEPALSSQEKAARRGQRRRARGPTRFAA